MYVPVPLDSDGEGERDETKSSSEATIYERGMYVPVPSIQMGRESEMKQSHRLKGQSMKEVCMFFHGVLVCLGFSLKNSKDTFKREGSLKG